MSIRLTSMQSYIIIAPSHEEGIKRANVLCEEKGINQFDISTFEFEKSVGIKEIRAISETLFLKPVYSTYKAVLIPYAQTLTLEAQNALLKVLEEPPTRCIIILISTSYEVFLPTVLSRCFIIEKEKRPCVITQNDEKQSIALLNHVQKGSVGELLAVSQQITKNKEQTQKIVYNLILTLRNALVKNNTTSENLLPFISQVTLTAYIRMIQKVYTDISTTNVNQRLAIEHLLFSLKQYTQK